MPDNKVLIYPFFIPCEKFKNTLIFPAMRRKNHKKGLKQSNQKAGKNRQTTLNVKESSELLPFLLAQMQGKSKSALKSQLSKGLISVDGKSVKQFNEPLKPGQKVTLNSHLENKPVADTKVQIMFEDPDIIIVFKKAGYLSIASNKEKVKTVYSFLTRHVQQEKESNKIYVIHRLDREISGLMVFAKNPKAEASLQASWALNLDKQEFFAIVEGEMKKTSGKVKSFLKENKAMVMYSSPSANDAMEALTHFEVIKKNADHSLVKINISTARKNQIRVHMKDLGHPIVGDEKYEGFSDPINRVALHGGLLVIQHPRTGNMVEFKRDLPTKFTNLMRGKVQEKK